MKAFKDCNKRCEGECSMRGFKCKVGQEIKPNDCWRMIMEEVSFLQCPSCLSALWFDNTVNSLGSGDVFFCPACNKDVRLGKAIQTFERLEKEHKKNKEALGKYQELSEKGFLTERGLEALKRLKKEGERIKEMCKNPQLLKN